MINVLALDLGATSGRGFVVSYNGKDFNMEEVHRFTDYCYQEEGHLFWNMTKLIDGVKISIQKAINIFDIKSVGVDTWGVDYGLIDSNGFLIQNPYHYRDQRTKGMVQKVEKYQPLSEIYNKTGIQLMEINTLYQLCATKELDSVHYSYAKTLLMMPDLINYLLTGVKRTERTIASTTQLYNPRLENWDDNLIEDLSFKRSLLTDIIDSGKIVGRLKESFTNNPELSIPVIAVGSHDTASAIVCTPFDNESKTLFLSSGTWSLLGVQLDFPVINKKAYRLNFSNETGVNNKITLLKNLTGLWLINQAKDYYEKIENREVSFLEINYLVEEAEDIDFYFDTDSDDLRIPNSVPETLISLARKTGQTVPCTKGEVFKTIYKNLSLKYKRVTDELSSLLGNQFDNLYIVGGGSNSKILNQYTANATHLNVKAGHSEATVLGNALVQLVALNIFENIEDGQNKLILSQKTTDFIPENEIYWKKEYIKYCKKV